MKLNRNVIQISSTAIITSLVLVTLHFLSGTEENTVGLFSSGPISRAESDALRNEYASFKHAMQVKYNRTPGSKTDTFDVLQGFRIDAKQLLVLITQNPSGKTLDNIIFYFGKSGEFRRKLRTNAYMHIIAIGEKDSTLLEEPALKKAASPYASFIYDKADPCPPHCAVSP